MTASLNVPKERGCRVRTSNDPMLSLLEEPLLPSDVKRYSAHTELDHSFVSRKP
jgi:hypothetical protein